MDIDETIRAEEDNNLANENEVVNETLSQEEVDYDSDTPPTAEEWKTMKGYGSFITHDERDEEHIFHLNDVIYVLPTGRDPDEEVSITDMWLAQIKSIRAHNNDSVWIRAKWFYHPTELPKNVKGTSGKLKHFGNLERISSNQADFIPTSTCCGLAKIKEYDEQNIEQEEIESGSFYYRCDYNWKTRVLKRSPTPCSICKKAYNPDTDVMHFCPRPHCRRSWHTLCLANANWIIKSPVDLPQRLESLDGDWTASGATDCPKFNPKKKARTDMTKVSTAPAEEPYARIPPDLLAVARQPIARGGSLGLVGNVRSVVRARTMVQNVLRGIEDIPEGWVDRLGKVYDATVIGPSVEAGRWKGRGKALAYQCPQCGEPI